MSEIFDKGLPLEPPPAGTGEAILVLAVGPRDGGEMQRAISEVKPGALVRVATGPEGIAGFRATEFVMTQAFRSQRTVRMILAAEGAAARVVPTHMQKGL